MIVWGAEMISPKAGQAHEWITSPEDITNLVCVYSGIITLESTSSILNPPNSKSDSGTIYESNSMNSPSLFKKSGYSYDQYHWCFTSHQNN